MTDQSSGDLSCDLFRGPRIASGSSKKNCPRCLDSTNDLEHEKPDKDFSFENALFRQPRRCERMTPRRGACRVLLTDLDPRQLLKYRRPTLCRSIRGVRRNDNCSPKAPKRGLRRAAAHQRADAAGPGPP